MSTDVHAPIAVDPCATASEAIAHAETYSKAGRLLRASSTLDAADARCRADAITRAKETLQRELDPGPASTGDATKARKLLAEGDAALARSAADAKAAYEASWRTYHPNGLALVRLGSIAKAAHDGVEAQRLFDRAAHELGPTAPIRLEAFDDGAFQRAVWSADGRTIAALQGRALVVVREGEVRLRIAEKQSPSVVRFDGDVLVVTAGLTTMRYDVTTGALLDSASVEPTKPLRSAADGRRDRASRRPDEPTEVAKVSLDDGGSVAITSSTTSKTSVRRGTAYFNDDTRIHAYSAPFDVVTRTNRYEATRVSKDGKQKTMRELATLVCTFEHQQESSIQYAGDDLHRGRGLGGGLMGPVGGGPPCAVADQTVISADGAYAALVHTVATKDVGNRSTAPRTPQHPCPRASSSRCPRRSPSAVRYSCAAAFAGTVTRPSG
ncbi:MAG: hypothetical protein ACHREM_15790, partial [Polyangiales bacterium]